MKSVSTSQVWLVTQSNVFIAVQLWSNKPDDGDQIDALGRIRVFKGTQRIFDCGANKVTGSDSDGHALKKSDGVILGARVWNGEMLDGVEFLFLKSKVEKTELVEMQIADNLDNWNKEQRGIEKVTLSEAYFRNSNQVGGPNLTYLFSNTITKDESKSATSQNTNDWTVGLKLSAEVQGGIPFLAEVKIGGELGFEYKRSEMRSDTTSTSSPKTLT